MRRPTLRKRHKSEAAELNYLNEMISFYRLYQEDHADEIQNLLRRFGELLMWSGLDDGSIILQDHWGLYHEVRSNLALAVEHRVREIGLIHQLFEIEGPVEPINEEFLLDKMRALVNLYEKMGETDEMKKWIELIKERSGR